GRLQRLGYISTAFVGGSYPDRFGEDDLDVGQRFRNSYEQSKFEAELVMHAHMRNLPITVLRPSIIIGHSQSGATSAFNVIDWPLRVFADGMLRYAPTRCGDPAESSRRRPRRCWCRCSSWPRARTSAATAKPSRRGSAHSACSGGAR